MDIYKEYKRTLYNDEVGDRFFLLKYGEAFKYSDNVFRLHL